MPHIVILLLFLVLTPSLSLGASVSLKLGHIAETSNPYAKAAEYFAELVKQRSQGKMEVQVYPAGKLGTQRDLIEGLKDGSVDMALTSTAVLANYIPELVLFDLPFIFRDRQHTYKVLDSVGMEIATQGRASGIITLAFWENGVRHMTNNVRPIVRPEDMKGLRIRVMEQPICIEMMKILGAKPIPMSITDLFEALKTGAVDGQDNPLAHIVTKRYYEVQKYVSLTGHTYTAEPLLVGVKTWDKLTVDQRKLLQKAAVETRDWQRQLCSEQETEFLNILRASDKCTVIDNVDKDAFRQATLKLWDLYTKIYDESRLNAILAVQ